MTGLGARGKLARDEGLLRYIAGFFMRGKIRKWKGFVVRQVREKER